MARYFVLGLALVCLSGAAPPHVLRFDGELTESDRKLRGGEFYDTFGIKAEAGQRLRVEMLSQDFDTYLIVKRPEGGQEEDDDTPDRNRSLVELTVQEGGEVGILATSYSEGETGSYRVLVEVEGP